MIPYRQTLAFRVWRVILVGVTMLFMHVFIGLTIPFGSYLTPFAVKCDLHLSKADGAHLTTLFWTTFTVFRCFSIAYLQWISTEVCIFGNIAIITIANGIIVPFGNSHLLMLWLGVAIMGIGFSSIWACVFGFLEEHLTVTPLMSAFMIVSAGLGEFVFPAIISEFIDWYPMILMWVTAACTAGIVVLFTLMSLICRFKIGKADQQWLVPCSCSTPRCT